MGPGPADNRNQMGEVRIDIDDVLAEETLNGATGLVKCHWMVEERDLERMRRMRMRL